MKLVDKIKLIYSFLIATDKREKLKKEIQIYNYTNHSSDRKICKKRYCTREVSYMYKSEGLCNSCYDRMIGLS